MRDNGRLTHLIRDVLAELAAGRRDVEREHATPVRIPHVQHVVANLKDVPRFPGAARQACLDILEQPLLVQAQQVRARRHPSTESTSDDARLWRQTRVITLKYAATRPPLARRTSARARLLKTTVDRTAASDSAQFREIFIFERQRRDFVSDRFREFFASVAKYR